MDDGLAQLLVVVTAVGSGVVGGVFFAFSTFVMQSLARLPAPTGIAAMQAINLAAPAPLFMLAIFGAPLVGLATAVIALLEWGGPPATWALIGSVLSTVPLVLTGTFHVPRNNRLAAVDVNDPAAATEWTRYQREWSAGNHVRTISGIGAATALTISLVS